MNLKTFVNASILMIAIVAVSCGPSAEEKARMQAEREQEIADSIAKVEAQKIEQQRQDSIRQAELKELYSNAITITQTGKKSVPSMTSESCSVTLTCTVTNNTPIALTAADYSLSCTGRYETCSDGSSPDVFRPVTTKSVDLAPGETKTVTFFEKYGSYDGLSKPKVKMKISEEEFLSRVADSDLK